MSVLASNEDTDETQLKAAFHKGLSMFAESKTIFKDKTNISFGNYIPLALNSNWS